jgi:hypothetical protein
VDAQTIRPRLNMYHVNEKLVCVRSGPPSNGNKSEAPLVQDALYVVTEVDPPRWDGDCWGIRVAGNRTWDWWNDEVFWSATRFRKLSDMQEEARQRKVQQQPV